MEVRKVSEFKSPQEDMLGNFVYFKRDFLNFETPEGVSCLDIIKALENLNDDECLVIPA